MKLARSIAVMALVLLIPTAVFAKQVTVLWGDLPFEVAKKVVLLQDKNLNGLGDDAIRQVLQNRGSLTFDDEMLSPELSAKLQAAQKIAQVTTTLQAGRDWAEIGRAIGIATREGLSAVTDETAKFAKTTPGQFTMVMIAWKIMGPDIMSFIRSMKGYIVGIPLLMFWLGFFAWWMRRVYGYHKVKRVVDGKTVVEEMPPLSVVWNKQWAEAVAKIDPRGQEKVGISDWAVMAGIKTVFFVVVTFIIVWFVI